MANFFSREELLGGLPARQASTVLFAIKSRTAYLMAQSRQAVARFVPPKSAEFRERDFLEALAQGRDLPLRPTIQDLERYAPQWAALAPDNPGVKAAIAHIVTQEYTFTYQHTPRLRQALNLDDEAVKEAYQRYYHQPLQTIYSLDIPLKERWRWFWAGLACWLEELPPFWTAFSLTITETVGASILALPIALAGVGPLPGIVFIVVLGLVNLLTMAGIVEAISRNGNMRYGRSFFGQLVEDYLGRPGSIIFTVALLALIFLVLLAFYIGITTTLAEATSLPAPIFTIFLFLTGLYFLRRRSLNATLASALVVGAINLSIILGLSLLTLPHIRMENLQYINVPFANGRPFDPVILQLIFGVVLASFFGHTSPANVAKVVLRREPSGRALMQGAVTATVAAIGIYSLWILAVNGAVAPNLMTNAPGTALTFLTPLAGPLVPLLGSIFVVLGMGITTVYFSLALFNQVQEWLPKTAAPNTVGWRSFWLRPGSRFGLGILPVALIVLLIEWLLFTGQESFTGIFSFLGIITLPLLGGVFPMLMLYASRRKGEYVPGITWRFLGQPVVVIGIYLLFLAGILVYGLFIWSETIPRLAALMTGGLMLVITFVIISRGAFTPRLIVELRVDHGPNRPAHFTVTAVGQPVVAAVHLKYQSGEQHFQAAAGNVPDFDRLHCVTFLLPPTPAKELKLWLHQISPEESSETLPVRATIQQGQEKQDVEMASSGGQRVLPFSGEACRIEIGFGNKPVRSLLADQ